MYFLFKWEMNCPMRRQILSLLILLIAIMLISACGYYQPEADRVSESTQEGAYRINPVFWEYYHLMGGEEVFGPAITNIFTYEGKKMQYVENGLLVYDPQEKWNQYSFSNLGEELGIYEPPKEVAGLAGDLIINGYLIHPAFIDLYRRLGPDVVGAPLTNPQENYTQGRIEQHFQNFGFYFRMDDPEQEVHLLAYGRAVCGSLCQFKGSIDNAIHAMSQLSEPFSGFVKRLGSSATGSLVGGPYLGEDGNEEVILENMVVYNDRGYVAPRPLVLLLGYTPQPPTEAIDNAVVVFIAVEGALGHNVLVHFDDYIIHHGGYEISGMPVSEIYEFNHEKGIIRQCFTNLCLDYYSQEPEGQVRPAQLGIEYKNMFHPELTAVAEETIPQGGTTFTPRKSAQNLFQLKVWESSPLISSSEAQVIAAGVFFNGAPQAGQQMTLTVNIPDAAPITVSMPPTGEDGHTTIALAPVAKTNGTLITYEVCLNFSEGTSQCVQESFLIWGN
jgi:hypothetical protein